MTGNAAFFADQIRAMINALCSLNTAPGGNPDHDAYQWLRAATGTMPGDVDSWFSSELDKATLPNGSSSWGVEVGANGQEYWSQLVDALTTFAGAAKPQSPQRDVEAWDWLNGDDQTKVPQSVLDWLEDHLPVAA